MSKATQNTQQIIPIDTQQNKYSLLVCVFSIRITIYNIGSLRLVPNTITLSFSILLRLLPVPVGILSPSAGLFVVLKKSSIG